MPLALAARFGSAQFKAITSQSMAGVGGTGAQRQPTACGSWHLALPCS